MSMSNQVHDAVATPTHRDIDDVIEVVDKLEQRIDTLEDRLEQKNERIEELESQVEIRGEQKHMENVWIAGLPLGKMLTNRKQGEKELKERVRAIEMGEVDPGEIVANSAASIDPSELLPLHQMYLAATNVHHTEHDLSSNKELAAQMFPYLAKYAHTHEGTMKLPSTKVQEIIEREIYNGDDELGKRLSIINPNPNKIRRAMEFAGQFGREIIKFDDSEKTNYLHIDRDAWIEYQNEYSEEAIGEVE